MTDWVHCKRTLTFTTPAFLGGADQSSELRTPPFKTLLRRWWRVAWWHAHGRPDWREMRTTEQRLFGGVHGKAARRSCVRIRLQPALSPGTITRLPAGADPQSLLYLGYGPLTARRGEGVVLTHPPGIAPSEQPFDLLVNVPQGVEQDFRLDEVFQLWQWFGTVGGRSRSGFGSLHLRDVVRDAAILPGIALPLDECLRNEWTSALGRDDRGPLVWLGSAVGDAAQALTALSALRRTVRGKNPRREDRSVRWSRDELRVLALPVTKDREAGNVRHPNSLLFKVLRDGDKTYRPLVALFPRRFPASVSADLARRLNGLAPRVWRRVVELLDGRLERVAVPRQGGGAR